MSKPILIIRVPARAIRSQAELIRIKASAVEVVKEEYHVIVSCTHMADQLDFFIISQNLELLNAVPLRELIKLADKPKAEPFPQEKDPDFV